MGRFQRRLREVILAAAWILSVNTPCSASQDESIQRALAAAQQQTLERHYPQAIRVLRNELKNYPSNNQLRLELGRAYLLNGEDSRAMQMFREVLRNEPTNRLANLELARALGFRRQYRASDHIYRELIDSNGADEAAAIGLASNLLHERRLAEAKTIVHEALAFHPDSLRLQEFKDRIDAGSMGGEEREPKAPNLVSMGTDYFNDSAGNHTWHFEQRVDLDVKPGLATRGIFEQYLQHSRDDSFEAVETFAGQIRWKVREWLLASGGGGAVRFNNQDVHAIYDMSLALQPARSVLIGASFLRIPIIPNAEASEHRLTAQGWVAFGSWTGDHWRLAARGSREHYSDKNIASRATVEATREWSIRGVSLGTGYQFRHYGFDLPDLAHGYFDPSTYQSHLAVASVRMHPAKNYRAEILARGGAQATGSGGPFSPAWEVNVVNELTLGNWALQLDYSRYHLLQDTGAFRAEAGQFSVVYHF